MNGVVGADLASELSEDESDTEIDFTPPTFDELRSTFELPSSSVEAVDGECAAPGAADPFDAASEPTPAAAAAASNSGAVSVPGDSRLELDNGCECARAQAALQQEGQAVRCTQRLQLAKRLAEINLVIAEPRFRLGLC